MPLRVTLSYLHVSLSQVSNQLRAELRAAKDAKDEAVHEAHAKEIQCVPESHDWALL